MKGSCRSKLDAAADGTRCGENKVTVSCVAWKVCRAPCKRVAEEPWVALPLFSVKEGHPVTSPFKFPLKFSTFRDWNNKKFTITFSCDNDLKLFVLSLLSSVVLLWWVHYSRQDSWSNPWRMGHLVILVPLHKDMWGRSSERRETMR